MEGLEGGSGEGEVRKGERGRGRREGEEGKGEWGGRREKPS
jgi:hypothetical protein